MVLYNVDVIVFEYLDTQGKKRERKTKTYFGETKIQKPEHKAHILGIRISHICAWNTSSWRLTVLKVEGTYIQTELKNITTLFVRFQMENNIIVI